MKRIFEIAAGIVSGIFISGLAVITYEHCSYQQREIERLKKRLDKIDKQLECIEVVEEEEDD